MTSLSLFSGSQLALDYLLPTSWTPAVATQQIKLAYLTDTLDFCECPDGCVCPDKSHCSCVPAEKEKPKEPKPVKYEWQRVVAGYSYQRVCGTWRVFDAANAGLLLAESAGAMMDLKDIGVIAVLVQLFLMVVLPVSIIGGLLWLVFAL